MNVKIRAMCLLALLISVRVWALDVVLNGEPLSGGNIPADGELFDYPQGRGVPLSLVIPPSLDRWHAAVDYRRGRLVLDESGAALLTSGRILIRGNSRDLWLDGVLYQDVSRIDISQEETSESSLEMWISWEGTEVLEELVQRFARSHGLSIEILTVPSILPKVTATARTRTDAADVFMVQSADLPELTAAGLIQPLDSLDTRDLTEKGRQAFSRDGRLWALPLYFDTQLVFYNPQLTAEPAADWTLADFERLLAAVRDAGIVPAAWNAYSAYWLISFQLGFGKDSLVNPDGGLTVNDEPTRRALEYLLSLQDRGLADFREREGMMSRFALGETAVILSGSYSIPAFRQAGLNFKAAPYPMVDPMRSLPPLLDYKGLAVSRRTGSPVTARALVSYLTDPGVQARLALELDKLPSGREGLEIFGEKGGEFRDVLLMSYERGAAIPPNDVYPIFKNTMWKLLSLALSRQMEPQQLLDQGQLMIDEKIQRRER